MNPVFSIYTKYFIVPEKETLSSCNVKLSNIQFTQAKNGAENNVTVFNDTLKFVAGPQTDYFRSPDGTAINNSPVIFTEIDNTKPFTFTAKVEPQYTLKFVAGPQTDYFRSPDGTAINNSPVIFTEIDNTKPFTFTAKVEPQFTLTGTYSAGVLYVYENDTHNQKLCFEQDENGAHRVVSVRTIGTSEVASLITNEVT